MYFQIKRTYPFSQQFFPPNRQGVRKETILECRNKIASENEKQKEIRMEICSLSCLERRRLRGPFMGIHGGSQDHLPLTIPTNTFPTTLRDSVAAVPIVICRSQDNCWKKVGEGDLEDTGSLWVIAQNILDLILLLVHLPILPQWHIFSYWGHSSVASVCFAFQKAFAPIDTSQ